MSECSDCIICKIDLSNPYEKVHYHDNKIAVVDTKFKKGHKIRIMVYSRKHTDGFSFKHEKYAKQKLIEVMKTLTTEDFLIFGTGTTEQRHWHFVACDMEGDDMDVLKKQATELIKQ